MHVVVNAAVSADGKLSTRRRDRVEISGPEDFARVDRLRAESDAVMVGVGTVLADDPHLDLDDADLRSDREARGEPPHPARVVADSRARTPTDARILDTVGTSSDEPSVADAPEDPVATTYLLVSEAAPADRRRSLEAAGAEVIVAGGDGDGGGDGERARVDLSSALDELEARGVDQLMVEGGGELLFSLFEAGLVDELSVYVGPMLIGGRDAPTLVDGEGFVDEFVDLDLRDVERLDDGVLLRWDVQG